MKEYAKAGFLPVLDEQDAVQAASVLRKAGVQAAELRWNSLKARNFREWHAWRINDPGGN